MARMGITPVVDMDRRFTVWNINDIYTNKVGSSGRYVPNIDDLVVDYGSGWWRCIHVDYETNYSTLIPWSFTSVTDHTTKVDIIVGGSSTTDDSYRLYVNTKTVPYEFSFDTRLKIYGSSASYIKLFKDGKTEGPAMSAVINSAGEIVSENIELENVVIPNTIVTAIKVPLQGCLTEKLDAGEVVNAIVYGNSGAVLAIFKVVVVLTNFVRTIDAGKKLITNISLVSPYLSNTDDRLIEYPSNMTLDSSALVGKVTYNDGSTQRYPVDGRKFQMHGLDNYVTSQIGQTVPVVLQYTLAKDEFSNTINQVGEKRFMSKTYRLSTVESDNLYSVKIFVVPRWVSQNNTWALDYYLYTLDRDKVYKINNYIEYGVNSSRFDGTSPKWGVAQRIVVSINLDKLGASFKYYRHVQDFTITLHQPGSNGISSGYYTLEYDVDSILGRVTHANVTTAANGKSTIDLSAGIAVVDHWLEYLYRSTEPLFFPFGEARAPTPTHVKVSIGDTWSREIAIKDILYLIENVNTPVSQGELVRLEFIANHTARRMHLGIVGLTARRI